MSLIPIKNLDFWIKNNLNVLLTGHAGCGKTHTVLEAFKRHGLKYQYYSSSTLDPMLDFIGIPREVVDEKTGTKVIDFIRPKQWENDEIEALFLDEYNRSKMAVRNAVMELIQFRSINGRKFNKLRFVWAAVNPDENSDSEVVYDVEPLDPAQKDRFQIHYDVPYEPDMEYMENKFGRTPAKLAIEWWKGLNKETKMIVSPRRLDYALEIHKLGGDLTFVVPKVANPAALEKRLGSSSVVDQLMKFMHKDFLDQDIIKAFFANESNYHYAMTYLFENPRTWNKFLPLLPPEKLNSILVTKGNEKIINYVIENHLSFDAFFDSVACMSKDSSMKKLINENVIKKYPKENTVLKEKLGLNKKQRINAVLGKDGISTISPDGYEDDEVELQKNYLEAAIKRCDNFISTPVKTKLLTEYVTQFYRGTEKECDQRNEEVIDLEVKLLNAVADRMHAYTFNKVLLSKVKPDKTRFSVSLAKFFAQVKTALQANTMSSTGPKKINHFKSIMEA